MNFLLCYGLRSSPPSLWEQLLHPEFSHVEIWRELQDGFYLALRPCRDRLVADVCDELPQGRIQKVTALHDHDTRLLIFGMKTCTTVCKSVLGIQAAWIITPFQLFNYVERHNGIV